MTMTINQRERGDKEDESGDLKRGARPSDDTWEEEKKRSRKKETKKKKEEEMDKMKKRYRSRLMREGKDREANRIDGMLI